MLKHLAKDSLVYGLASGLQKLVPFLIIPVITTYLGSNALKVYDVSFVYAYLFSWLIILGQDSAASVLYFNNKNEFDKKQVLNHGLIIQLALLALIALLFLPFRGTFAHALFHADAQIETYWLKALWIVPGHIVLNYALNILIWQKRKTAYFFLCLFQVVFTIGGISIVVVTLRGSMADLFQALITATSLTALAGLWLVRKEVAGSKWQLNKKLLARMTILGMPFALTSFFHQLLPSIDRYFLLEYNVHALMPQYILAVKIGSVLSVGVGAFALAFTPYSMSKINEEEGEKDISTLFRFVSVLALIVVPVMLLFKDLLISFFADASYGAAAELLPLFFFAWVFDLFSYFAMLGVYKSQRSWLVLLLFAVGIVVISGLNMMLIPVYGIYGAALSFCITKVILFFLPLFYLRKYFRVRVDLQTFFGFLTAAAACSYLIYKIELYQYLLLLAILLAAALFYLNKLFKKHRSLLTL